jgi:hypothetical protein
MIVLRHGHLSLVHSLATSEQNVIHEVSNEAGVIQSRRSDESSKETLEAGEWVAWVARRHAANATRFFTGKSTTHRCSSCITRVFRPLAEVAKSTIVTSPFATSCAYASCELVPVCIFLWCTFVKTIELLMLT